MNPQPVRVKAMLGRYPTTAAFRDGTLRSDVVQFDFADSAVPHSNFKRMVRGLEFDVSELAIITFLIARAHGKPLVLLPTVVLGRFQHPFLVYDSARGVLGPGDLNGKRIGVRSYSVTTVTWVRGILMNDFGLDIDSVRWITCEEGHVAEFVDPPTCTRAPAGASLEQMLLDGEIDAAVLGAPPENKRIRTVFPDPQAAGLDWHRRYGATQNNHMVVVKDTLSKAHPEVVREIYRLLKEAKAASGEPKADAIDTLPFGFSRNRRNLEIAIDYVYSQRLIPRRFTVDELFDDVTRTLD